MLAAVVLGAVAGQARRGNVRALEAERVRLRERLAEERLGMARELHDVLAHTVSAISVQSGVALDAFDGAPEQARAAIAQVRTLARRVLPEPRRTLALLRDEDHPGQPLAPQPGLAKIGDLVEHARRLGRHVGTELVVPESGMTAFIELTTYRVV